MKRLRDYRYWVCLCLLMAVIVACPRTDRRESRETPRTKALAHLVRGYLAAAMGNSAKAESSGQA